MTGAVFDLDGTLIDSMPVWDTLGEQYLSLQGKEAPDGLGEILKPMTLLQCGAYFAETFHIQKSAEQIVKEIEALIADAYFFQVPLKPGAGEYVKKLYDSGVKLGIVTATAPNLAQAALERLKIRQYFSFLFTCEQVGCGKDSSQIFEMAVSRLKTKKSETTVFEDALHAIRSAKAAGLSVTAVYDLSSHADWTEISRTADRAILNFTELLQK